MNSPEPRIYNRVLTEEQIESAYTAATLEAIRENQRFGLPMLYWQNGQIVEVDPFEAEVNFRQNRNLPEDL